MDGIDGDEGDSGGAVCSGESVNRCILLGMVVRGDNKTRALQAARADHVVGPTPGMPLNFRNRTGDALVVAETAAAELRTEKLVAELRGREGRGEGRTGRLEMEMASQKSVFVSP